MTTTAGPSLCVDWGDPDERAWLIDDLVTDARAVLDALEGSQLSDEQAQAAALLAVVAGQDVEADPKVPGRWRIARPRGAGAGHIDGGS